MLKQQIHLLAEGSQGTGAHPAQLGRQDFGNVLSSILLEVSSPKKPRWNFCLHSAEPAESSGPGIPHTHRAPGRGVPGGTAGSWRVSGGCKGTHRHRESQEQPQSPPSPLFPKFLGAVGQSLDVTRSSLFPPTTESKLHGPRRLPGGHKGWAAAAAAAGAASRKARDEGRRV